MWVRYCRPPIGAHFHPNPQPPPVPQQLGEKAHLRIALTVGDFMLLFARWQPTTWRGASVQGPATAAHYVARRVCAAVGDRR